MTTENNKIIAEFMGALWNIHSNKYGIGNAEFITIGEKTNVVKAVNHYKLEELLYHSDWNWLMEVILKINQFENQRFSCLINSMDCKIHDNERNKFIVDSYGRFTPDELFKSIYTCVVYFIKWYNNQN